MFILYQVGYDSAKGLKKLIFHEVEKVLIKVVMQGHLDSHLVRNVDRYSHSYQFMDSLVHQTVEKIFKKSDDVAREFNLERISKEYQVQSMLERQAKTDQA